MRAAAAALVASWCLAAAAAAAAGETVVTPATSLLAVESRPHFLSASAAAAMRKAEKEYGFPPPPPHLDYHWRRSMSALAIDLDKSRLFCVEGAPQLWDGPGVHPAAADDRVWCEHEDGVCCPEQTEHCCRAGTVCGTSAAGEAVCLGARARSEDEEDEAEAERDEKKAEGEARAAPDGSALREQAEKREAEARKREADARQREEDKRSAAAESARKNEEVRKTAEREARKADARAAERAEARRRREAERRRREAERPRRETAAKKEAAEDRRKVREQRGKDREAMRREKAKREADQRRRQEERKKNPPGFRPLQGHELVPASGVPDGPYTLTFWVRPGPTHGKWRQLLHKGDHKRARAPALWLIPGTRRLHVRSAVSAHPGSAWNAGVNTESLSGGGKWTHVAVAHGKGYLRVYFDGRVVVQRPLKDPFPNKGGLWGCSPWYRPADVRMSDIRVRAGVVPAEQIANEAGKKRTGKTLVK